MLLDTARSIHEECSNLNTLSDEDYFALITILRTSQADSNFFKKENRTGEFQVCEYDIIAPMSKEFGAMNPDEIANSMVEEQIAYLDGLALVTHLSTEQKLRLAHDISFICEKLERVGNGEPYPVTIPVPAE